MDGDDEFRSVYRVTLTPWGAVAQDLKGIEPTLAFWSERTEVAQLRARRLAPITLGSVRLLTLLAIGAVLVAGVATQSLLGLLVAAGLLGAAWVGTRRWVTKSTIVKEIRADGPIRAALNAQKDVTALVYPSVMKMTTTPKGLAVVIRDIDEAWGLARGIEPQVSVAALTTLRDLAAELPETEAEVAQVHRALGTLKATLKRHNEAAAALQAATEVPVALNPPSTHRSVSSIEELAKTVDEDASTLQELAEDERWR